MTKVCTLHTDLSRVPKRAFRSIRDERGVKVSQLSYSLEMRIDSASMEFELKVDGVGYGSVAASFDD